MTDYAKVKYRYFFLSFSIAFLTLSLMFLFLMNIVHPKTPEVFLAEPETGDVNTAYLPSARDSLSVLFMGVEDDGSACGTFILARFNPASGKVPVAVFPPQTAVKNNGKTESLSEVYSFGGAEYTKNALGETLGVPIDRYIRVRMDSFLACAAAIGSVEFDLPADVTVSRSGAAFTLNKGRQLLDGQKVADIIRYGGYSGGETERCRIAAELTCAIVNQRMDICLSVVVDNVFEKIINLISTDISYTDYYDRKRAAEFLASMSDNPAEPVVLSGEWSEDKKLYTLSDTTVAALTQSLS